MAVKSNTQKTDYPNKTQHIIIVDYKKARVQPNPCFFALLLKNYYRQLFSICQFHFLVIMNFLFSQLDLCPQETNNLTIANAIIHKLQ